MKVLLTVTGSWGTGSFQVAKGVALALIAKGHTVKIFFPDSRVKDADLDYYYSHPQLYEIWQFPIESDEARLETFPLMLPDPNPRSPHAKTFNQLSPAEWQLYFISLKVRLQELLEHFQPDVVECQHLWAIDHVISELKYPYVCVAHNSDQLAYEFDPSMHTLAEQSAENAPYIFAVSTAVKAKVIAYYKINQEKVIVIPCGYDERAFKPKQLKRKEVLKKFGLDIPDAAKLVCFSGKISHIKGIDILLMANGYLPDEQDIHLLVMGSGDIQEMVRHKEKSAFCLDRVHFLGHRTSEEVAAINNISKVNVVPSRSEGFCISGLEALACGTPLIMSDAACVGEYAVAAKVPLENPERLAEAIVDVLTLPDKEYARRCQEALSSAQEFTWDRIVQKRLVYYEKLIKRY